MTLLLIIGLVFCVIGFIAYRKPDRFGHVPRRDVVPRKDRKVKRQQWEDYWYQRLN